MKTYLLKAPDEDMERWKSDARLAGLSFAEYLRNLLNAESVAPYERAPASPDALAQTWEKRSYVPDPK